LAACSGGVLPVVQNGGDADSGPSSGPSSNAGSGTGQGSGSGSGTGSGQGRDGGATDGAAPSADSAVAPTDPFCSGPTARLTVNGADDPIMAVQGKSIAMNCCYSGGLVVDSAAFQAILAIVWRVPATSPSLIPGTIDVSTFASLSMGGLELDVGCDPSTQSCTSAPDRYTSGFQGTLQIANNGSGGFDATYCISVSEPSASPHPLIHSLHLYAPHVAL
jgi:hypothetical protein